MPYSRSIGIEETFRNSENYSLNSLIQIVMTTTQIIIAITITTITIITIIATTTSKRNQIIIIIISTLPIIIDWPNRKQTVIGLLC